MPNEMGQEKKVRANKIYIDLRNIFNKQFAENIIKILYIPFDGQIVKRCI